LLLERFNAEGLRVIPLKGSYLASRIYSRKEARPYRDIDLMFRQEDLGAASRILKEEGFTPRKGGPEFVPSPYCTSHQRTLEGGRLKVEVDLHVSMHWPREYFRRTRFNQADIWGCSREDELAGMPVTSMSPEHLLICTCLDLAMNHRFARLIALRDLFEMVSGTGIDFEEVSSWSRRWEVCSFVYLSLDLLCRLGEGRLLPEDALERMRPRYPMIRLYRSTLIPSRLPSMRARSLTPRNLLFFLLGDHPAQRLHGLRGLPRHLYSRVRHP
jgi:hypothetical protein